MMNLLALGTELPLQMTADGQPALNCPLHGTQTPVVALLDLSLELLPCGCPRADIADYWAEKSPMLKEWLCGGVVNIAERSGGGEQSTESTPRSAVGLDSERHLTIDNLGEGLSRADACHSSAFQHETASSKSPVRDADIMLTEDGPSPDLGVLSELPEIGGDANDAGPASYRPPDGASPVAPLTADGRAEQTNAPPSGGEDGASTAGSEGEQGKNSETLPAKQAPELPLRDTALEPVFRRIPPQNLEAEQALLGAVFLDNGVMSEVARAVAPTMFYRESHREIYRSMQRLHGNHTEIDAVTLSEDLRTHGELESIGGPAYVAELASVVPTAQHFAAYAEIIIEKSLRRDAISGTIAYLEGLYNGNGLPELATMAKRLTVPQSSSGGQVMTMDYAQCVQLNQEYLARPEIIERLGYAQSIALIIGGKHHGKTTNVRTLALSVCRGLPIWGRKTTQGPVLYMASDDELAPTRNELLSMGWAANDSLMLGSLNNAVQIDVDRILADISTAAIRMRAVMIVLDMLFDFAGIKDELSYAATRASIGQIQWLADATKALVVCSHHTPKYLTDVHSASNAALGSQGISARFSPIILTRKWTEKLYTVESTTTRDPRGEMLQPTRIVKADNGWIETGGEFKEWMKWEIYAERVLSLFENLNQGLSVQSVAEKLGLDRSRAQNTVKELMNAGKLRREKTGQKYLYYLASSDMFEREGGNWNG